MFNGSSFQSYRVLGSLKFSKVLKIAVELYSFVLNDIGKLFGRVQPKERNKILLKFFESGFFHIIYTYCHKIR